MGVALCAWCERLLGELVRWRADCEGVEGVAARTSLAVGHSNHRSVALTPVHAFAEIDTRRQGRPAIVGKRWCVQAKRGHAVRETHRGFMVCSPVGGANNEVTTCGSVQSFGGRACPGAGLSQGICAIAARNTWNRLRIPQSAFTISTSRRVFL